jgi:hypothetical protein
MVTRVIVPPAALITPADVPGSHAGNDPRVARLIAAAQEEIDGPEGWLGRAIGPQTLETTAVGFGWAAMSLPCPPLIEVLSVKYLDTAGVEQTAPDTLYEHRDDQLWLRHGQKWPHGLYREGAVRIRYRAGYDGAAVDQGGTGPVPERVKEAIILSVVHALSIGVENLFLRSEEVEGVGTMQYTVSTVASDLINAAIERRLSGLRIYS